ncbi:MAG TPA: hypothetical protein VGY53_07820, partial [Isosphaeraceae bacterium]|nr:hypothetical protein [Isosphaeraceae bacterium]
LVSRAEGHAAFVPFWRGEYAARTPTVGAEVGALCRVVKERLDDSGLLPYLEHEHRLTPAAARWLRDYVARQLLQASAVPDDQTVLVESFTDPTGELGIAVLTPFGGKLHQSLKLALQARLRQRLGIAVAGLHGDDGLLLRLPQTENPPLDLLDGLTAEVAESLICEELGESPLFGLRFRQNAGRALLMPRPDPGKRAPLWLQRLRAKDLLQVARRFPDFPIVVETYRECLADDLSLPTLRTFLDALASGKIRVVKRRAEQPSPFASELIFHFMQAYLYEWDEPRRGDLPRNGPDVDLDLLKPLLEPGAAESFLDPAAVGRVEGRLRGTGQLPRSANEMAEWLRRLGDLAPSELVGPMAEFLAELERQERACLIRVGDTTQSERWIGKEEESLFASAFAPDPNEASLATIVERYLRTHALVGLDQLLAHYPIDPVLAGELLERWAAEGKMVRLEPSEAGSAPRWADRRNLEDARRLTLALKRRESVAVCPEVFADFVARRQGVHPETVREGAQAVEWALEHLAGCALPFELWEAEVLPRRVRDYRPGWLDETLASGAWTWRAEGSPRAEPKVAFVTRDFPKLWPAPNEPYAFSEAETCVLEHLEKRGASFVGDLALETGLEPSRVRSALVALARMGLVTNDRIDPLRLGLDAFAKALGNT